MTFLARLLLAFILAVTPVAANAQLTLTGAGPGSFSSLISAPFVSVNGPTQGPSAGPYNGWSVEYAGAPPNAFTPNLTAFSVTRQGFTTSAQATTYVDTFYVTQGVRQPYPNEASSSASTAAVNDYIYSTDTVAGSVTNNSTVTSPKPVCLWVSLARTTINATVSAEIVCAHRNARLGQQVAAVQCRATDDLGATVTGSVVSAPTLTTNVNDLGGKVIVYLCTVDTSTLDPGVITLNAKAWPWIGGAASVVDSVDSSEARGFSPRYFFKNATLAASPYYVYVNANTGNDGTCVASQTEATAAASPCLTVSSAAAGALFRLDATASKTDAGIIKIDADATYVLTTPTTAQDQNAGCVTITRSANATKAGAKVSFGAAAYRAKQSASLVSPVTTGCMRFNDITILRTGTLTIQGEAAAQLEIQLDNINFDNASNNATWLSNSHSYMSGVAFTNLTGASALGAGTYEHRLVRGVSLVAGSATTVEAFAVLGSSIRSVSLTLGSGSRTFNGGINGWNYLSTTGAGPTVAQQLAQTVAVNGFANLGNQFEYTGGGTVTAYTRISGDSATVGNTHIVSHMNTYIGAWQAGRCNCFYDEGATPRNSTLQSIIGDIWTAPYIKGDVFQADGTRLGNFPATYGVGFKYLWAQYRSDGVLGTSQALAYGGVGSSIGTSDTVPQMATTFFTAYQGTTYDGATYTAGAPPGTYTLNVLSPVKNFVTNPPLNFDYAGTSRCGGVACTALTTTAAGVYESP